MGLKGIILLALCTSVRHHCLAAWDAAVPQKVRQCWEGGTDKRIYLDAYAMLGKAKTTRAKIIPVCHQQQADAAGGESCAS